MRKYTLSIFVIFLLLLSCKKDRNEVAPNVGYSYAGLEVGKYVVFDVDSHHYNIPFNIDTLIEFQIKEVVDSKYTDLEGDEAFKIIRYRKEKDSTEWILQDVWNAKLTATNFQKTEENIRYVKMIFPVRGDRAWNGNIYNNEGEMQYEYTNVHQQETIGSLAFDSVTTILQYEDINLVQERYFEEKFAASVGLVYKQKTEINKAYSSTVGLWLNDTGNEVIMTISTYGN